MFGLLTFAYSNRIIEDMVKQDKVDILDLFLESGVDIGHFLSEEGQAFTRPRVIMDDIVPPCTQTDIQQDAVLDNTLYAEVDFLNDNVSAVVEVSEQVTPPVIQDSVAEVVIENSQSSTSYHDCISDGFHHLEENVATQFPFDDLDPSQNFFAEEVSEADLDIDLSPLLKEGIKHKIKARRIAEGKEEIRVEFKEPSPERLTPEEEERRKIKREKNKLAAQKCRNKKRKLADTLEEETLRLEEKQEKLQDQVQRLREEREHLLDLLKIHSQVCPKMAKIGS
ncbi:uncharacterized protein LOC133183358 isoform X2 [Saccostrea echinata]|uniref:uncharacterized protein LOC133183358 isoform X2 n=1 Tax=Saccostrea echinata TaxID=191078 RepID=UPI002A8263B3|nr:uncharacterized protein LOC133183358 isoform X2 [Saccostrea echinata]